VLGEKTPELIYVDECILRMKQVCPNAKFLFFIRDPVPRAYSAWNMNRSKQRESAPFDECIENNLRNLSEHRSYGTAEFHYVQRGFYMDQIERLLKVFPDRSKLLVVVAERVRSNPSAEYKKIFDFLGVDK
jgi:Sulfotransferase domain